MKQRVRVCVTARSDNEAVHLLRVQTYVCFHSFLFPFFPTPPPQRRHVLEWVRAMIAVALGVPLNSELPPIYIQEATESAHAQISE